jgi:hypothetical protein
MHSTTNRKPLSHLLGDDRFIRPVPREICLDDVFLHRAQRKVRKDGTVRFGGRRLEVAADLTGAQVELRFRPSDPDALPRAFVDGVFVCDTVELDLHRNATRRCKSIEPVPELPSEPTGIDPPADIERQYYDRVRLDGAEPTHKEAD